MEFLTVNLDKEPRVPKTNHTSKGDQPKWRVGNLWVKADHMGYESLSETLVSALLPKTNVPEFVSYSPITIEYRDKLLRGCSSKNFKGEYEELIPIERLHRLMYGESLYSQLHTLSTAKERIQYTVNFIEEMTHLPGVGQYLTMILELDQLFLNEDRHTNNIAVIRNVKTDTFRLCPIFDNGLSLLSDTTNDYCLDKDIYQCIERVKAKPFSEQFEEQTDAAEQLYGSFLRCSFTNADVTAVLQQMEPLYPDNILSRVQTVMFEQMRRLRFLFPRH